MPITDPSAAPFIPKNGDGSPYVLASADGAISVKGGTVFVTKGSACVLTLAAPAAGEDDGRLLEIVSTTAFAHTVTQSSPGFNSNGSGSDVGTFAAAKGNGLSLRAYNGAWYVVGNIGVTLA
jgi:hypothetical protein